MHDKGMDSFFWDVTVLEGALNQRIFMEKRRRLKLRQQRFAFALFLKILLKRLEQSGDETVLTQAKIIVKFYSKRYNRILLDDHHHQHNVSSCLMIETMEGPLRRLVGEHEWIRAHFLMRYYLSRQQEQQRQRRN